MKSFILKFRDKLNKYILLHLPELIILMFLIILFMLASQTGYLQFYFNLSIMNGIYIILIIAIFLLKIKGITTVYLGIVFLVLSGFLYAIKFDGWSERTSVYAFYFLFIGIIQSSFEFFKEKFKK